MPGFASLLCHVLTVQLWGNLIKTPCLGFLIFEMGIAIVPASQTCCEESAKLCAAWSAWRSENKCQQPVMMMTFPATPQKTRGTSVASFRACYMSPQPPVLFRWIRKGMLPGFAQASAVGTDDGWKGASVQGTWMSLEYLEEGGERRHTQAGKVLGLWMQQHLFFCPFLGQQPLACGRWQGSI